MKSFLQFFLRFPFLKSFLVYLFKKLSYLKDDLTIGNLNKLPDVTLNKSHLSNCRVLPHREALLDLLPSNSTVAEIGVAEGFFSQQIIEHCSPKKLHLIDSWNSAKYTRFHKKVTEHFTPLINKGTVIIHKEYSTKALSSFNPQYFDWVYIDTVHDYSTTVKELELSLKVVKDGGYICGHDYTSRSYTDGLKYGVVEAVHEFCAKHKWEFIYLTLETNGHNSFALRKMI